MTANQIAGIMLIAGSTVFLVGAAIGVPMVFTQPDAAARLRLLQEHLGAWRAAQPLYALGPIVAAVGVGRLAAAPAGWTRAVLWVAASALLLGALPWAWSVYLRAGRISEFAFGSLPGWPFTTYVLLTIGGLGLLGIAILAGGFSSWLGWLTGCGRVLPGRLPALPRHPALRVLPPAHAGRRAPADRLASLRQAGASRLCVGSVRRTSIPATALSQPVSRYRTSLYSMGGTYPGVGNSAQA